MSMKFELGKSYIVQVTENGIVPIDEFSEDRFIDRDADDLDVLTEDEKVDIINTVVKDIKADMKQCIQNGVIKIEHGNEKLFSIIDKHMQIEENIGHWIAYTSPENHGPYDWDYYRCSKCGHRENKPLDRCPSCHTYMEGND